MAANGGTRDDVLSSAGKRRGQHLHRTARADEAAHGRRQREDRATQAARRIQNVRKFASLDVRASRCDGSVRTAARNGAIGF